MSSVDEANARELADEQLGRLLVATDLAKGDGSRAVSARSSVVVYFSSEARTCGAS
jgi:hypothetical protein